MHYRKESFHTGQRNHRARIMHGNASRSFDFTHLEKVHVTMLKCWSRSHQGIFVDNVQGLFEKSSPFLQQCVTTIVSTLKTHIGNIS